VLILYMYESRSAHSVTLLLLSILGQVVQGVVHIQNIGVAGKTTLVCWSGCDKGRLLFGLLGGVAGLVGAWG
jgi:hypothetical protein